MVVAVIIRSLIGAVIGALVGYLLTKTPRMQMLIRGLKVREMESQTEAILKRIR